MHTLLMDRYFRIFLPLPKTTPEGEVIIIVRGTAYDPSKVDLVTIFKVQTMITDILVLENDNFVIAGVHPIVDLKGGTASHFGSFSPILIKKIMKIFQHAYPLRPKSLIYLNTPSIFGFVMDIVRNFLTEKLKNRVSIEQKLL